MATSEDGWDSPIDWGVCVVERVEDGLFDVCRISRTQPTRVYENTREDVRYFGRYRMMVDAEAAAAFLNGLFSLIEDN